MRLSQFVRILWVHRRMGFGIFIATLALAAAASFLLPKKYTGESAVVVDERGIEPLAQQGAMPVQLAANFVATQVDVIESHNVALKVVDKMKLVMDPEVIEKFNSKTGGVGSIRDWEAEELLKSLSVKPARESNVIFLQFAAKSPQVAADIANSFADNYITASLELKVDPARRQAGWFDQQVNDLRVALETAQQKLSSYQAQHSVIGNDDSSNKLDTENARLNEISTHMVAAQAAMYDAETRQKQMNDALTKGRSSESVTVLQNPLLQNLKTELARSEARFADVSQRFDHNHPQYMSAQAELESLRAKVAGEVSNAVGTVAREAQIARQNMTDLQRAMEQQRKRILDLQHNQDEYTVLKRDVESARAAYDSSLQRGGETRLESRLNNTNTAILNYAYPPMKPSSPRLLLNLALAIILGSMLAVSASLIKERFDPRVHSRADLLEGAELAVLAELPRARISTRRHRRARKQRISYKEPRVEPA
ncbi:MAG TPA: chain length determinant protein EpsF [Steroidobacteraceae bacterium]|jgi:polysaccharide biosynthesis transport protein|nr:chain length determinant protein EpsF [Steroidobacteraceae bacterium]